MNDVSKVVEGNRAFNASRVMLVWICASSEALEASVNLRVALEDIAMRGRREIIRGGRTREC
jgi:hypothetical protein